MSTLSPASPDISQQFQIRRPEPGHDDALMERVFELRFQVYCEECRFLPSAAYPQRSERDAHDAGSTHFCAFNHADELVGYVRLVRPDARSSLPFQHHSPQEQAAGWPMAVHESAEVSRLMVRQDYRRPSTMQRGTSAPDGPSRLPKPGRSDHSPQIMLSLFRSVYAFSADAGIRYLYAAMERSLARILTRGNFPFQPIGPSFDYFGQVAPYRLDLRDLERAIGNRKPWQPHPSGLF